MDISDLYREEILDHYQNPRNFGKIEDADAFSRQTNPLCGDDIAIEIEFECSNQRHSAKPKVDPESKRLDSGLSQNDEVILRS